jgi:predicted MFS family arabinose efflux permease
MRASSGVSEEWREHWPVVLSAFLAGAVEVTYSFSLGVFLQPIQSDLGWTRAQITAGMAMVSFAAVLLSMPLGILIDRYGARRVGLPGIAVYCTSFAAISLVTASIWTWWLAWFFVAIGSAAMKPMVWTTAVVGHFRRSRGLALGVTLCGTGFGGAVVPYVSQALVAHYGWRTSYVCLGLGGALITLPLALCVFYDARDKVRRDRHADVQPQNLPGFSARESVFSWRFVRLGLAGMLATAALYAMVVHFVPLLSSRGTSRASAAGIASLIGISSLLGRLICGYLTDRLDARRLGALLIILPVVPALLLLHHSTPLWLAGLVALTIGLSLGGEVNIVAYLSSRYFGIRSYGTIFGALVGVLSIGQGVGPFLMALSYDHTGSYNFALLALCPMLLLAAALILFLGAYPILRVSEEPEPQRRDPISPELSGQVTKPAP